MDKNQILHFESAACTKCVISSRAFFFALSVIPSNASSSSGVVNKGSNSRMSPSFVGTRMKALGLKGGKLSKEGIDEDEPELECVCVAREGDRLLLSFRMTMLVCRFNVCCASGPDSSSSSSMVSGISLCRLWDGKTKGLPLMLIRLSFFRGSRG